MAVVNFTKTQTTNSKSKKSTKKKQNKKKQNKTKQKIMAAPIITLGALGLFGLATVSNCIFTGKIYSKKAQIYLNIFFIKSRAWTYWFIVLTTDWIIKTLIF